MNLFSQCTVLAGPASNIKILHEEWETRLFGIERLTKVPIIRSKELQIRVQTFCFLGEPKNLTKSLLYLRDCTVQNKANHSKTLRKTRTTK